MTRRIQYFAFDNVTRNPDYIRFRSWYDRNSLLPANPRIGAGEPERKRAA